MIYTVKPFRSLVLATSALSILVLALIVSAKRGFDECFEKNGFGDRVTVPCPTGLETMSTAELQESLNQFRAFEKSDLVEEVFEAARKRDAEPKGKTSPYKKKITEKDIERHKKLTPEEFRQQEALKAKAHREYINEWLKRQRESDPRPEISKKVNSIRNGKYFVRLGFINNADFPKRYVRHTVFQDNTTEEFARDWEKIIFKHYLGDGYESFTPELYVVNDLVVLNVYLGGSKSLERILDGQPIKTINHIGTPEEKVLEVVLP